METAPELITRLKRELAQARATRDRIEKTGESSSFGGVSFTNAAYDAVLRRISRLERDLYSAEASQAGLCVSADVRLVKVSGL